MSHHRSKYTEVLTTRSQLAKITITLTTPGNRLATGRVVGKPYLGFPLARHPLAIGGKLQMELHPDIIAGQTEQPCAN